MKERKNGCLHKQNNSNTTNHDIKLLFVIQWQHKQSICVKNRAGPRPHPKKKKSLEGKGPTSDDYRATFLLNFIYIYIYLFIYFKDCAFFLINDIKDTTNFFKLVFIVLLAHFSFSFLLRLLNYETNRTLKYFLKMLQMC